MNEIVIIINNAKKIKKKMLCEEKIIILFNLSPHKEEVDENEKIYREKSIKSRLKFFINTSQ